MRSEGWAGGRMEERRKALEERAARLKRRNTVREEINQTLCLDPAWWGESESDIDLDDADEVEIDEVVYVSFGPSRREFHLRPLIIDSSEGLRVDVGILPRVATGNISLVNNQLPDHCS